MITGDLVHMKLDGEILESTLGVVTSSLGDDHYKVLWLDEASSGAQGTVAGGWWVVVCRGACWEVRGWAAVPPVFCGGFRAACILHMFSLIRTPLRVHVFRTAASGFLLRGSHMRRRAHFVFKS